MTDSPPTIKRSGARAVCSLTFDAATRSAAEQKALERFGATIELPGFRPGKAPLDQVRAKVKDEELFEETVRLLIAPELGKLIEQEKLRPIIPPRVEVQSREPLTIQVTLVERPEVKVKGLEKLTVEKKEIKIDPKDIARVEQSILADYRTTKEVDRAAATGDQVIIDFAAVDMASQPVAGLSGESYPVTIGSANLLPGFEEQLVGLKKGDEKKFSLTLPATHPSEQLKNKPVSFSVKAHKVEEVILPELSDAFVKEKLGLPTLSAFKETMEQSIRAQEDQFEQVRRERELLDAIRKNTVVDLPQELVDEEVRGLIEELMQQLQSRNVKFEDWLKQENKKPEDVEKDLRARAVERLTLRFGMGHIIEEKKIEVSNEEMETAVEEQILRYPKEQQDQARATLVPGNEAYDELRWRKQVEKAMEGLLK